VEVGIDPGLASAPAATPCIGPPDAGKYADKLRHNVVTAGFAATSWRGIIFGRVFLSAAVMTAECGDFNNNYQVAQGS
jgi:hypothetical protein